MFVVEQVVEQVFEPVRIVPVVPNMLLTLPESLHIHRNLRVQDRRTTVQTMYILNEEKSVNATAALRKSMQDTNGYKLQMFCAEFIPNLLIYAVMAILALLSKIPFVGILFAVITVIVQQVRDKFGTEHLKFVTVCILH